MSQFGCDPDYAAFDDFREKNEQDAATSMEEETVRQSSVHKIQGIIDEQFGNEIKNKDNEVMDAHSSLEEARNMLDRLRACTVASYYAKSFTKPVDDSKVPPLGTSHHPAIKNVMRNAVTSVLSKNSAFTQPSNNVKSRMNGNLSTSIVDPCTPPASPKEPDSLEKLSISTVKNTLKPTVHGGRCRIKKTIIVGNISKYISAEQREGIDKSTHKWMVYVRGPASEPRIDHFIRKVWFFLHPSYRPNDLVEVHDSPFHLTRRGWGEFPIRVQLHFCDPRNKPVDILHNLKLDRTYTGLQTLGMETVCEIELDESSIEPNIGSLINQEQDIPKDQDIAIEKQPRKLDFSNENSDENSNIDNKVSKISSNVEMSAKTEQCEETEKAETETKPDVIYSDPVVLINDCAKIDNNEFALSTDKVSPIKTRKRRKTIDCFIPKKKQNLRSNTFCDAMNNEMSLHTNGLDMTTNNDMKDIKEESINNCLQNFENSHVKECNQINNKETNFNKISETLLNLETLNCNGVTHSINKNNNSKNGIDDKLLSTGKPIEIKQESASALLEKCSKAAAIEKEKSPYFSVISNENLPIKSEVVSQENPNGFCKLKLDTKVIANIVNNSKSVSTGVVNGKQTTPTILFVSKNPPKILQNGNVKDVKSIPISAKFLPNSTFSSKHPIKIMPNLSNPGNLSINLKTLKCHSIRQRRSLSLDSVVQQSRKIQLPTVLISPDKLKHVVLKSTSDTNKEKNNPKPQKNVNVPYKLKQTPQGLMVVTDSFNCDSQKNMSSTNNNIKDKHNGQNILSNLKCINSSSNPVVASNSLQKIFLNGSQGNQPLKILTPKITVPTCATNLSNSTAIKATNNNLSKVTRPKDGTINDNSNQSKPVYQVIGDQIYVEYLRNFKDALPVVVNKVHLFAKDGPVFAFTVSSREEFTKWNIGKQKAAEWQRATLVFKVLEYLQTKSKYLKSLKLPSKRFIVKWCYLHGHSHVIDIQHPPEATQGLNNLPSISTLTKSEDIVNLLSNKTSDSRSPASESDDSDIDILSVEKAFKDNYSSNPDYHENDVDIATTLNYPVERIRAVEEMTKEIELKFPSLPVQCASSELPISKMILAKALEQFIGQIKSKSLHFALSNVNSADKTPCAETNITSEHVSGAISSTKEFDFLTDANLASENQHLQPIIKYPP